MTCEQLDSVLALGRHIDELDAQIEALWQQMDKLETERKAAFEAWQKARGFKA